MPCTFSGLFYVNRVNGQFLECSFIEPGSVIRSVFIQHFQIRDNLNSPFPEDFAAVEENAVYQITGTVAVVDNDFKAPKVCPLHNCNTDAINHLLQTNYLL